MLGWFRWFGVLSEGGLDLVMRGDYLCVCVRGFEGSVVKGVLRRDAAVVNQKPSESNLGKILLIHPHFFT